MLGWASVFPPLYPTCDIIKTYWWDGLPNFGDLLTPFILRHYGIAAVLANRKRADLVGIGSVLTWIPESFGGTIWGSGLMEATDMRFPAASVVALRGHKTHEHLGRPDVAALGDPGLLASRVVVPKEKRWDVGLVPHHSHERHPLVAELAGRFGKRARVVDVRQHPGRVVREIAACRTVVSTSLHGVIVADSYGIPTSWAMLDPVVGGGEFKFHDYESVVLPHGSRAVTPTGSESLREISDMVSPAHGAAVTGAIRDLEASIGRVAAVTKKMTASPFAAWGYQHQRRA